MNYFSIPFLLFVIMGASCGDGNKHQKQYTDAEIRDQLIDYNKGKMNSEDDYITSYVESHQLDMEKSDTGMRFLIAHSGEGDSIRVGEPIEVGYDIRLDDSTLCYSSEVSGPLQMLVEGSEAPPGFHEVVQKMRRGDSARCIWPSRLGYGMTGDLHKIPLNAVLLVDLEVKK